MNSAALTGPQRSCRSKDISAGSCEGCCQLPTHGRDRVGDAAFRSERGSRAGANFREGQIARRARCDVVPRGDGLPLGDQESISRDAKRGVVVKATPASPLVVVEPDLPLELLIIGLDAPAQLGGVDELGEVDILGLRREPIFDRFPFVFWLVASAASRLSNGHSITSHSSRRSVLVV